MNLCALYNVLYEVLYCNIITNLCVLHMIIIIIFLHYNNELYVQLYVFYRSIVLTVLVILIPKPYNTCSYLRDIAYVHHFLKIRIFLMFVTT